MKIKLLLFFCLLSSVIIGQGTGSVGVQSRFNKDVIVKWYDHQYQGGIWRQTPVFVMDSSTYLGPYPAVFDFVISDVNKDKSTDIIFYAGDENDRKSSLGLTAQESQLNLTTYGNTFQDTIAGIATGGQSSILAGNDLFFGTNEDNKVYFTIEDSIRAILGDSNYWHFMTKFRDFDGTENDGSKVWGSDENGFPKWVDRHPNITSSDELPVFSNVIYPKGSINKSKYGFYISNDTTWLHTSLPFIYGGNPNDNPTEDNLFIGRDAGNTALSAASGYANTGIGYGSLANLNGTTGIEGRSNTALGYNSGHSLTTGTFNTFVGTASGENITTGDGCVFIGWHSGLNQNSDYSIGIGTESLVENTAAGS